MDFSPIAALRGICVNTFGGEFFFTSSYRHFQTDWASSIWFLQFSPRAQSKGVVERFE